MGESNWSDASVHDWVYDGDFTASLVEGTYVLNFTNIYKSGKSQANGDWSGPKPIPTEKYTKELSVVINIDGTCKLKKDKWGVLMNGGKSVHEFFKTYYPNILKTEYPKFLNGSFSGNTTTENDRMMGGSWFECYNRFDFKPDGTFTLLYSYANHDYSSDWEKKDSGTYSINNTQIIAGKNILLVEWKNGETSQAIWNGDTLKWN